MGKRRATRYTPATTIVAACISAETGVGPSMASGSQICSGNMADFPAPPMNMSAMAQVRAEAPMKVEPSALLNILPSPDRSVPKSKVCVR